MTLFDPAAALLTWYDTHRRVLPWRALKGRRADPYHVWLSEIMLQQTTVQAVAGYYRKFLARWPTVAALAEAPLDDVLAAWAGLGYYARARNLHKCAVEVAQHRGGKFPGTAAELKALPGIGAYTAGAIAAIAFDQREAAMDANAERVAARYSAMDEPFPGGKVRLRALGQSWVPEKRAGDFAQALMDLGSAICTVKRPACANCPIAKGCRARELGIQETLPIKAPKMERPLKRGAAFVAVKAGAVLLVKRPDKGLLASMLEPPLGPWTEKFPKRDAALGQAPFPAEWKKLPGVVRHGFTHFELEIEVWTATVDGRAKPSHPGKWVPVAQLGDVALPTVMRKIIAHALPDNGPLFRGRVAEHQADRGAADQKAVADEAEHRRPMAERQLRGREIVDGAVAVIRHGQAVRGIGRERGMREHDAVIDRRDAPVGEYAEAGEKEHGFEGFAQRRRHAEFLAGNGAVYGASVEIKNTPSRGRGVFFLSSHPPRLCERCYEIDARIC